MRVEMMMLSVGMMRFSGRDVEDQNKCVHALLISVGLSPSFLSFSLSLPSSHIHSPTSIFSSP